ncbi:hypothetical protein HMPREF0541_00225 [Lacticaseibacillus rhamnosus ATCC 21052]|nr:hypothetical protein HMPREF0541_00225 [Lacticaseibacillus rhamnosus ATCC 21052]
MKKAANYSANLTCFEKIERPVTLTDFHQCGRAFIMVKKSIKRMERRSSH